MERYLRPVFTIGLAYLMGYYFKLTIECLEWYDIPTLVIMMLALVYNIVIVVDDYID